MTYYIKGSEGHHTIQIHLHEVPLRATAILHHLYSGLLHAHVYIMVLTTNPNIQKEGAAVIQMTGYELNTKSHSFKMER